MMNSTTTDDKTCHWHLEEVKSGDDMMKCLNCGSVLVVDYVAQTGRHAINYMQCWCCGSLYKATKTHVNTVEKREIAIKKLGEKIENLHVGTDICANLVMEGRVVGFNERGNKVSIEMPIMLADGSTVYGTIDEVPMRNVEIIGHKSVDEVDDIVTYTITLSTGENDG